ncbi:hypothetical protein AB0O86_17755 [Streptomyces hirsutus]|uniref:hypothetical protein n=1 Tax=Streptomyces hirsutus TaxID=35620 RepID=UPI003420067F
MSAMPGRDPEQPLFFTVRVTTGDGTVGASPFAALTGGIHGLTEYQLSLTLMRRLVGDGGTGLDDLLTWRRDHGTTAPPGREEHELLLLKWAVGRSGPRRRGPRRIHERCDRRTTTGGTTTGATRPARSA